MMLDNGNKMFKRVFHGTGLEQPLVHICVLFGWENSLLQILDAFPHMVNLVNGDGSTLMDLAKETGNLKFMELLSKFDALETKRCVMCLLRSSERCHCFVLLLFAYHGKQKS